MKIQIANSGTALKLRFENYLTEPTNNRKFTPVAWRAEMVHRRGLTFPIVRLFGTGTIATAADTTDEN